MDNLNKLDGALLALVAYGAQDKWIEDMKQYGDMFDSKKMFLTNRHTCVFRKLDVDNVYTGKTPKKTYLFRFLQTSDLINNVNMLVNNPENIKSICVEFGGQRFDKVWSWKQLQINAAIHRKPITQSGDTYIIPLCLAPFHDNNLVTPSAEHHKLHIYVEFIEDYNGILELYGNVYFLDSPDRRQLFNKSHEFSTIQHQYTGGEKISKGLLAVA